MLQFLEIYQAHFLPTESTPHHMKRQLLLLVLFHALSDPNLLLFRCLTIAFVSSCNP